MTGDLTPRWVSVASRASLALLLFALTALLTVRPFLTGNEAGIKERFITQTVAKGPVTVDDAVWKLESLRVYTRLVDEDKNEIELDDRPPNSSIVVAEITITPTERSDLDTFTCDADLRDQHGSIWKANSTGDLFKFPIPTFCGSDDLKPTAGKPMRAARIYIVPTKATPDLVGIVTPGVDNSSAEQRVLITP